MLSPSVDNLVAQLTRLPGIGSRTAQRLAFHVLSTPKGILVDRVARKEHVGGEVICTVW